MHAWRPGNSALHSLFNARGVVTFHSPMPATELFCRATQESLDSFKTALFGNIAELPLLCGQELQRGLCVGLVKGPIVGGNLAVLTSLCGTEYQPDFEGCILGAPSRSPPASPPAAEPCMPARHVWLARQPPSP